MRFFRRSLLVLFAVLLLVVILQRTSLLAPVEGWIAFVLRPIQRVTSDWFPAKSNAAPVSAAVRDLQAEVTRFTIENARLREALRQQAAAGDAERFLAAQQLRGVSATVIGRAPSSDKQLLLLDAGTEARIEKGQPVVSPAGALLGIIADARLRRSTVLLLTSTYIAVGARVDNETQSPGIIAGEHGLTLRLNFVPQGEKIVPGQHIFTSDIDERVPANLLIGTITEVHFATGDLFQQASVRPAVDLERERYVTVIQQ